MTNDPREFISGAAAIGLGFGVMENLGYLASNTGEQIGHVQLGAIRGIVSAPGHLAYAFIQAVGIWSVARRGAPIGIGIGIGAFALAVALHGTFDAAVMAWPDPTDETYGGFGAMGLGGVGLVIIMVTLAETVLTLYGLGMFLQWSQEATAHDPGAESSLDPVWPIIASLLAAVAAGLIVAPGVIAACSSTATALIYAPILVAAAGSMAMWSMAIRRLAD